MKLGIQKTLEGTYKFTPVRASVGSGSAAKTTLYFFLFFGMKQIFDVSDFWRKFSFSTFWPFLVKILPFLATNDLFGPFLPNATLNFSDFGHRN